MATTVAQMPMEPLNLQQSLFLWAQCCLCWAWVAFAKAAQVNGCHALRRKYEFRSGTRDRRKVIRDFRKPWNKVAWPRPGNVYMGLLRQTQVHSFWAGWTFLFVSANHRPGAWTGWDPREGTVSLPHAQSQWLQTKCSACKKWRINCILRILIKWPWRDLWGMLHFWCVSSLS